MMKVLKKNQMIIFVIALMLVAAGYLSYTSGDHFIPTSTISDVGNIEEYAGIGDATLVNSNIVEEKPNENKQEIIHQNTITQERKDTDNFNNETISTASTTKQDDYFTTSKLGRDTMYSQMIESYQKILDNANVSAEQKNIATQEIQRINETKNAIMIAENLIKTKGLENCVIFVNDKSISVIVKADSLEQDQIAQIQNIVARELKADIQDIHISNK